MDFEKIRIQMIGDKAVAREMFALYEREYTFSAHSVFLHIFYALIQHMVNKHRHS